MEVKVYYQSTPLATYSGDTTEKIMDQIGEHLHSLLSQTGKQLGNAAGYILEDIYAEIDLKNCEINGSYTIPVTVSLPEGYELVNDVSIVVNIEDQDNEAEVEANTEG